MKLKSEKETNQLLRQSFISIDILRNETIISSLHYLLSNTIIRKDRSKLFGLYVTEQFVQIVYMTIQDRRITKTRKAIYTAFLQLLNQKDYESITVQEIIDLADVGRSTFYSHYESKELLLDELCRYLFHHLFEREENITTEAYLAHIFSHFKKNQDHVSSLLLSKNDYFLRQLQKELEHHVYPMVEADLQVSYPKIPASYLKHFVVTNFIETLTWWLKKGKDYKENQVVRFYLDVMEMTRKQK